MVVATRAHVRTQSFAVAMLLLAASAHAAELPTVSSATAPEPPPAQPATPDTSSKQQNSDEIVVTAQGRHPPSDPLDGINTKTFAAVQAADKAIIGPVARGYKHVLPKPVRDGLRNFLNNLNEPIVFVNFLLQLKPGKAAETAGRFAINTVLGGAGFFDVARRHPFGLPRRSNGLADTLGYYGVKPGPYLFLPIIGSTTVRDMFGRSIDLMLLPTTIGNPFNQPAYTLSSGSVSALDERAEMDGQLRKLRDEGGNPYAAMRDYYLQRRKAEIEVLHGKRRSLENPGSEAPQTGDTAPSPATGSVEEQHHDNAGP